MLGSGTISLSHGRSPRWKDYANGCIVSSLLVFTETVHFLSFTLHPDFVQWWCVSQPHEHPTASEKQLCSLDSGCCSPQTTRNPQRRRTLKTKIRPAHLNTGFQSLLQRPPRADAPGCAPGSGACCLLGANGYLCPQSSKQPSSLPTLLPAACLHPTVLSQTV